MEVSVRQIVSNCHFIKYLIPLSLYVPVAHVSIQQLQTLKHIEVTLLTFRMNWKDNDAPEIFVVGYGS